SSAFLTKKSTLSNAGRKKNTVKSNNNIAVKNKLFPIVVIGASAGGLEAYTTILRNLQPETGMAYVIIQHMDPLHKSFLIEILSRDTQMKVNAGRNGMKPRPDNIYTI